MAPHATLAVIVATGLLTACSGGKDAGGNAEPTASSAAAGSTAPSNAAPGQPPAAWGLVSSGEGTALVYPASGETATRLFCAAGAGQILVNVPGFRPIGSEERLSFGSGGAAHALVAGTSGDWQRGGVSGTGAVPGNLAALIDGPVAVSYGAQASGPHPAPPPDLARAFTGACSDSPPSTAPKPSPTGQVSACLMQGDERLANLPLRAVGTEPFWGATIEGRCVTYSHPDNQQGTRLWTRYTATPGGGTWTGTLEGRPFVLRTRSQPGCSDGMSDNRYPIAVELTVGGEERQGCARPG